MSHICLNTDQLHEIGRHLIWQARRLEETGRSLRGATGSLDTWAWDGASRWRAEPLLDRVRPESARLVQRLDDLGRKLLRISEAFEQADSRSAAGVEAISWFTPQSLLGWRTSSALRLGSLLAGGGAAGITLTRLPATGTEGVSFVDRLKGIPDTVKKWLSPAIITVAGWFGMGKDSSSGEPLEPVVVAEPGKTTTQEKGKDEGDLSSQAQPKVSEKITTAPLPPRALTPVLKQTARSYECAPTAASMVLGYWYKRDPKNKTLAPQELVDKLGRRFSPSSGINADELVAGLKEMKLGYRTIERQALLDKNALQTELNNGPVLAQVHLNWGTNTNAHMVTVTGMSENGQTVYVNDPWIGKASEISWPTFERSWTFGGQYKHASNLIVKIRPT